VIDEFGHRVREQIRRGHDARQQHFLNVLDYLSIEIGPVGEMPIQLGFGGACSLCDIAHADARSVRIDGDQSGRDELSSHRESMLTPAFGARIDPLALWLAPSIFWVDTSGDLNHTLSHYLLPPVLATVSFG